MEERLPRFDCGGERAARLCKRIAVRGAGNSVGHVFLRRHRPPRSIGPGVEAEPYGILMGRSAWARCGKNTDSIGVL